MKAMVAAPETRAPWTPARIASRSLEILREEGVRGFWFKLLAELGYRRLLLLQRPLAEPIPELEASLPLQFDLLEPDDIDAYLSLHDDDPRTQIEGRFRLGEVCFIARHEGRIVCGNWAAFGSHYISYIQYDLPIGPDDVYLYDSYTDPDFRGRGIAPALAVYILRYYRDTGVRLAVTAITPENLSNRRARAKSGYRELGLMGYLGLGPWRRHFHWVRP